MTDLTKIDAWHPIETLPNTFKPNQNILISHESGLIELYYWSDTPDEENFSEEKALHWRPVIGPNIERGQTTKRKYSDALLNLATSCGAMITGKPDGSEAIEIVFSIEAWRRFDLAIKAEGAKI